jgi:hypothetical protein
LAKGNQKIPPGSSDGNLQLAAPAILSLTLQAGAIVFTHLRSPRRSGRNM